MTAFFALVATALAAAPFVAADVIPEGAAAHFISSQTLALAPQGGFQGATLQVTTPGDGSSSDITALFATRGTGQAGQIAYGDWCISANGVVPGTATQVLYVTDCSDDAAQLWTVNESPATISNADGNCITLGKAAKGAPVTLSACTDELQHLQLWNAQVVSA
ncbi:hypothetical protein LXA43DRAFT_900290 [Ganoderma leucocontextum]|nr:hypothetical protein LXA43DRAFT_900290 [Ganoderma leucocontextum]